MPKHRVDLSRRHTCPPWPVASNLYYSLPGLTRVYTLFYSAEPVWGGQIDRRPHGGFGALPRPSSPTETENLLKCTVIGPIPTPRQKSTIRILLLQRMLRQRKFGPFRF